MEDVARPRRRGSLLPAGVAALGIFAYLLVVSTINQAASRIGEQSPRPFETVVFDAAYAVVLVAAFAAACWLSFWLVAPVEASDTFGRLVVRILVAAGVAFVVLVPVGFFIFSAMFAGTVGVGDSGIYDVKYPYLEAPELLELSVREALTTSIGRLPIITLAALALWWWLRRKESTHGEA